MAWWTCISPCDVGVNALFLFGLMALPQPTTMQPHSGQVELNLTARLVSAYCGFWANSKWINDAESLC
jgi:hypothetical protein